MTKSRVGYRLTEDAEWMVYQHGNGSCQCRTSPPPCSWCVDTCSMEDAEDVDEYWEIDPEYEEVKQMSRSEITNKSDPPKSKWFNGKYRVNSETSKLLQEAVFKDGGDWRDHNKEFMDLKYDNHWLFVTSDGELSWSTVDVKGLPEKQPPQPSKVAPGKKDFVVGKWYKCATNDLCFKSGQYYKLAKVQGNLLFEKDMYNYVHTSRFDIKSESDYDPNTVYGKFAEDLKAAFPPFEKSVDTDVKACKIQTVVQVSINRNDLSQHKHIGNNATTNVGDTNMSNQNRVVSVKFFDDDAGLKAENSLVASYEITTRANDAMTVNKLLMREDIAGDIDLHNAVRASTVDATILKNTGNKVFLQPIDFEDLRVEVRQV